LVSEKLAQERQEMLDELKILVKNIAHIKDIVGLQQSYAKVSGVSESVSIQELVADAININRAPIERNDISVSVSPADIPQVMLERQKVLQILVNLVKNAADALTEGKIEDPTISVSIESRNRTLSVHVADNGIGIAEENLTRVFAHGFTTKKTGHGFGLHTGALAATEMGGALRVESGGAGEGATFILEMPLVLAEEQHA
jgi:C4-dicarboxylate-specific signal transduction histidine kinase